MDQKARKILFRTYWQGGRWTDKPSTDPDDFACAKEKGLMFDPVTISHDDCVARIKKLASEISQDKVVLAFLSSLSPGRPELRSGIASWFIAAQIPEHSWSPVVSGHSYSDGVISGTSYTCGVCRDTRYGVIGAEHYRNQDVNVLNFERMKWGGIRHGDLLYTMFDLEQFRKEDIPELAREEIAIFNGILRAISESEPGDYPGKLAERFAAVPGWKSGKNERHKLIEILACLGVLKPGSYNRPRAGKNDWVFAEYWRGEDKYDEEVVRTLFGKYVEPV